ncbi:MAG: hypothetical protein E7028_01440 [Planctomycetaceae bacterium]|nr:hypothetical protein [Planctomycetaceae bacterium]
MPRIFTLFLILAGGVLFLFSLVQVDVFTWKDSNKLERLVITTRSESERTDYPAFPEEMSKDDRLQHQEGLVGLSNLGISKIKKCFPPKEGEGDETNPSQHANVHDRPHQVSKPSGPQEPLEAPSVPESQSVRENNSIGTSAAIDTMRRDLQPDLTIRKIHRIFEHPKEILTASFSVEPLRPQHLNHEQFFDELLTVLAQFDLVGIQGIYAPNPQMLRKITENLSIRTGREYAYTAIFPNQNPSMNRPVPVFLYDRNVLEVDPSSVQLVGQVNLPFAFPPLAAKYRVKKVPADRAFTFIAVNMQIFPEDQMREVQEIPRVIAKLKEQPARNQFDREDDVIIFGHFGVEPRNTVIGDSRFNQTLIWANPEFPTNTFGKFSFVSENILFQANPLAEYGNMSGIWDLKRQFKKMEQIPFDHHPVWARFSCFEGVAPEN